MSNGRSVAAWVGWLMAGLLLLAVGVSVLVTRVDADHLSTADQVASVIAAVTALAGLPMAVYAVVLARRAASGGGGGRVRQKVRAGRDANVVGRNQRIGSGMFSGGGPADDGGRVDQKVRADGAANVVGRDQHIDRGPDRS